MSISPPSTDEPAACNLPKRVFLDWNTSLLEQLTTYFLPAGNAQAWFDLSGHLLVTPTRESGRKLRESLAKAAAARGKGLLAPTVVTTEAFFTLIAPALPLAGELTRLAVWHDVLLHQPTESLLSLFPNENLRGEKIGGQLILHTARTLLKLQVNLGLGGLTIADTRQLLLSYLGEGERERWLEMVHLEGAYFAALKKLGLHDPHMIQRQAAKYPQFPATIKSIHLLALGDPPYLLVEACGNAPQETKVEVLIFGNPNQPDSFDLWGRPLAEAWGTEANLLLPINNEQIHPLENPEQEAAWLAQMTAVQPEARVLGVGNPELIPRLLSLLQGKELRLYVPDGIPAASHPLVQWLDRLADFVLTGSWSSLQRLARTLGMARFLTRGIEKLGTAKLLKILDVFQKQRLPSSLDAALHLVESPSPLDHENDRAREGREKLALVLHRAQALRQRFQTGLLAENLPAFFNEVFGASTRNPAFQAKYMQWIEAGTAVRNLLAQFTVKPCNHWPLPAQFRALKLLLADLKLSNPREDSDHEAWGWLELLWLEQKPLAIAGMNENLIPSQVVADPFLPGVLRDRLQPRLPSNAQRYARDSWIFMSLLHAHPQCEVSFSRVSNEGDVLRPSRLLFLCPPVELPKRVQYFFKPAEVPRHLFPAKTVELVLNPRLPAAVVKPEKVLAISPTKLRNYLACPFRYYLGHVLKMKEVEAHKNEFDSMDFGNLCHEALRIFGEDEAMRNCQDERVIAEFLEEQASAFVHRLCGPKLPAAVMLQVDAARQRLRAFATEQAKHRREGWKIREVETDVSYPMDKVIITGRIDRIDVHDDLGLMIIDYKTSNKAYSPVETHLSNRGVKDMMQRHPWRTVEFMHQGQKRCNHWTDLQLPLYYHALRQHSDTPISASYFNLPLSSFDCGLKAWQPMDDDLMRAAEACAREVIQRILTHQFWPPGKVAYDDYQSILPGLSMTKGKGKINCEFEEALEEAEV